MKLSDRLKESFKETFIGRNFKDTIFIKEFSDDNSLLNEMEELYSKHPNNELLKKDIMLLKYGLIGEKKVAFELKNSQIPMFVLHDIRLEYNDLVAQFDFIAITGQYIYCIETKNLSGDIKIDKDGNFYRLFKNNYGKIIKKEGMYNPITQNERHLNLLKNMLIDNDIIKTYPLKSLIVVSNEKTIIDKFSAPKEVIKQLHRADKLIETIKKEDEMAFKQNGTNRLVAFMREIAEFILKHNKPIKYNLEAKYSIIEDSLTKDNYSIIYQELKEYRLSKSKELNIKPYLIYNNEEMERIIDAFPLSKEGFLNIKGFKEKKYNMYGKDIISIFTKYK